MARIRVFKGREARLNKAIFRILAYESPLSIYEIWRKVRAYRDFAYIRYHVVNRRVRALVEDGYIERDGQRKTKTGFTIYVYRLSNRAYLAMILNTLDLNEFIETALEENVLTALTVFASHTTMNS
jgi:DNA-binding Lrp family transcriptional regulator